MIINKELLVSLKAVNIFANNYHPETIKQLRSKLPMFDWHCSKGRLSTDNFLFLLSSLPIGEQLVVLEAVKDRYGQEAVEEIEFLQGSVDR